MPLATQSNVEALLLRALTANELSHFAALAALADTAIEGELPGFTLAADSETVDVRVNLDGELWTPRYPVTAVTSVTFNGAEVADPDFEAFGPIRPPVSWGWRDKYRDAWPNGAVASVTYSFGYASGDEPGALELVAAEMVAGALTGPQGGVRQEQLGDHMVGYSDKVAGGRVRLDDEQRRKVRRFRRQITSLPIDRAGP